MKLNKPIFRIEYSDNHDGKFSALVSCRKCGGIALIGRINISNGLELISINEQISRIRQHRCVSKIPGFRGFLNKLIPFSGIGYPATVRYTGKNICFIFRQWLYSPKPTQRQISEY